jgi:hypothetical protein
MLKLDEARLNLLITWLKEVHKLDAVLYKIPYQGRADVNRPPSVVGLIVRWYDGINQPKYINSRRGL